MNHFIEQNTIIGLSSLCPIIFYLGDFFQKFYFSPMSEQEIEITDQSNSSNSDKPAMTKEEYWRKNITCVLSLLVVWFFVSYGCAILFVEQMNKIQIGGSGFGFWMAQQGSIYVFVALIFVYVRLMNKLESEYAGRNMNGNKIQTQGEE